MMENELDFCNVEEICIKVRELIICCIDTSIPGALLNVH